MSSVTDLWTKSPIIPSLDLRLYQIAGRLGTCLGLVPHGGCLHFSGIFASGIGYLIPSSGSVESTQHPARVKKKLLPGFVHVYDFFLSQSFFFCKYDIKENWYLQRRRITPSVGTFCDVERRHCHDLSAPWVTNHGSFFLFAYGCQRG